MILQQKWMGFNFKTFNLIVLTVFLHLRQGIRDAGYEISLGMMPESIGPMTFVFTGNKKKIKLEFCIASNSFIKKYVKKCVRKSQSQQTLLMILE